MKRIILILVAVLVSSCQNDIENITISGSVLDSSTKKPLKDVEIEIICWIYGDSIDQSYTDKKIKRVKTDNEGKYLVTFEKGAFIEVIANFKGYLEVHESGHISSKKNIINVKLKPE